MSVIVTKISINQTTSKQIFLVVVELKLDYIELKCIQVFLKSYLSINKYESEAKLRKFH